MASNEDILREADYYLDNDVNVDEASSNLGISRRTFQLHMKKLEEIAPEKFKLVNDKKESNIRRGNIKGGSLGKRKPSWTNELATEVAKKMIDNGMTYEVASNNFGIPKSTLHEMTKKGVKDPLVISLLYGLVEANKRGFTLEEYLDIYKREHSTVAEVSKEVKDKEILGPKRK